MSRTSAGARAAASVNQGSSLPAARLRGFSNREAKAETLLVRSYELSTITLVFCFHRVDQLIVFARAGVIGAEDFTGTVRS